jgi:predicted SPOUT superfamily RNA methylase MTH1
VNSTTGAAVGATVGYGVGVVGGIVVYTVAAEAHAAAVQIGSEKAGILAEQAKNAADSTIRLIKENAPDKVDAALQAVNDYASKFKLPFRVALPA